jgi:mannitol/fructose-specific phosphotransferase system IIA component (Ntr-type)
MKHLSACLREGIILLDPVAPDINAVLAQVVSACSTMEIVPVELQTTVQERLLSQDTAGSTAIGYGVSIPHAYVEGITRPIVVFVRLKKPLDADEITLQSTRYLFVLLGPTGNVDTHLDTLATIARAAADRALRYELRQAKTQQEALAAFDAHVRREAPQFEATVHEVPKSLRPTGQFAGGLFADVQRKLPHYASDFSDGLHLKSITATLFLFFACLAPAVTFGGLMYAATGNTIGVTEMLIATAGCGLVYSIFAGQPLIILGGTGPLLIFTGILYKLCDQYQIDFLSTYAWVGLWTAAFTVLLAVTDASCLISKLTRFTDEIFAGLISIIFIVEAGESIFGYIQEAHQDELAHDVAFLSIIMALGTFIVAMMLSRFRKSRYLVPTAREFLADFGPSLAVLLMLAFGLLFPGVNPDALAVPETFGTTTGRAWLIPLTATPTWVWIAAAGPALLATLLIYLDQNITARLVNNRDHMLHKGDGYHLDLMIVGVLIAACSMLGLPWLVAATVRSLNHVRALATVEDRITPSGERRDEIVHVRENRITGLAVHLLIGACLFFLSLLQLVPNAVLYGLFLYMGIVSIAGNQLFERVGLWIMDSNLYPRTHYIRQVPHRVIHAFTALQVVCLVILWVVKTSAFGILFPLFIGLLVPIRMLAAKFFEPEHLASLDAEQLPEEEDSE